MKSRTISRRHFFYGPLLAGAVPAAGFASAPSLAALGYKSPNEKLNIAAIGAGGKGFSDLAGVSTENIVALADPDEQRAARSFERYPKAARYKDFRIMLDKEAKNIDAVLVSCPDHLHGTAAMWSMARGKHVYCQKPLTRTVWEAQELLAGAARYGVATQMGNQGYSNVGAREACEIVWNGDLGDVTEVHAWTDRPGTYWAQGPDVEPKDGVIPPTLDWDVWQGGIPKRAFSTAYLPGKWRGYPEFGCGAIGDMACHILGTPNMALKLGWPSSVECIRKEGEGRFTFPASTAIRFDFPARPGFPALKLFWYDSLREPFTHPRVPAGELLGDSDRNGTLFVGDKHLLTTGCYGERTRLVPDALVKDYQRPPQVLTRSPGHYRDWLRACKGGERSCSDFAVAAPFVSWMLLGVIAMKHPGKLEWDAQKLRFTNNAAANQLLKPEFRKDWKFLG